MWHFRKAGSPGVRKFTPPKTGFKREGNTPKEQLNPPPGFKPRRKRGHTACAGRRATALLGQRAVVRKKRTGGGGGGGWGCCRGTASLQEKRRHGPPNMIGCPRPTEGGGSSALSRQSGKTSPFMENVIPKRKTGASGTKRCSQRA